MFCASPRTYGELTRQEIRAREAIGDHVRVRRWLS
jgi:hypothetical protein